MSDIARIVGERIRGCREAKGLSQEGLGELAGLHGKYIGQLERGEKNATIKSVEKVARALRLPLETLFANIVAGDGGSTTAQACYNLIVLQSEKEQRAILDLVKKAIDFKRL